MPVRITPNHPAGIDISQPNGRVRPPRGGRSFLSAPGRAARRPPCRNVAVSCGSRQEQQSRARACSAMPCWSASSTSNLLCACSRSASSLVKRGGMCCTITTGSGNDAGNLRQDLHQRRRAAGRDADCHDILRTALHREERRPQEFTGRDAGHRDDRRRGRRCCAAQRPLS